MDDEDKALLEAKRVVVLSIRDELTEYGPYQSSDLYCHADHRFDAYETLTQAVDAIAIRLFELPKACFSHFVMRDWMETKFVAAFWAVGEGVGHGANSVRCPDEFAEQSIRQAVTDRLVELQKEKDEKTSIEAVQRLRKAEDEKERVAASVEQHERETLARLKAKYEPAD